MANKVKGITLEIGGDSSGFTKAIDEADAASRSLGKELSEINKGLKFDPNNVELLGQKVEVTSQRVEEAQKKLKALKDVQKDVEEAFKRGDIGAEEYRAFCREVEQTESQVKTFSRQNKEASDQLKTHTSIVGKAKDAINKFKEAHPAAAKAMDTAAKAAKTLAKAGLDVVKGAAVGAVGAVGAVAAGAVALGKAIFNAAGEVSEAGDQIDKASQKMGVSAEEYQKLSYAAELSGTSMATLQKATQKLQAAGSELDVSQAIDQLMEIEDADKRAAAAHEMFGDKIANELAPMLNEGAESLNAAKQAAEDYGLVMSDAAIKASAAFDDTKTTMTSTVEGIRNNLVAELLPGINEIMEGITGIFTGDESATGKIEHGIKSFFDSLNGENGVIKKVINIFNRIIDTVVEMAPTIIPELVNGLLSAVGQLSEAAIQIISVLCNSLLTEENITNLMNAAVKLLTDLVSFLGQNANMLVTSAITIVTTLINAFSDPENSQTLVHGAIDLVSGVVTALIDNAPMLIDAALEMCMTLAAELATYDWWGVAKKIFNSIKDSIKSLIKGFGGGDEEGHAGGLDYVPYNGYRAELHEGEAVLTAAENAARKRQEQTQAAQIDRLTSKVDSLTAAVNRGSSPTFNVTATGSYSQLIKQMRLDFKRADRVATAW